MSSTRMSIATDGADETARSDGSVFARNFEPFARFALVRNLNIGDVCFCIQYVDQDMLIPMMRPLVFIGKDLDPDDSSKAYFQDFDSYEEGIRWDSPDNRDEGTFESFPTSGDGEISAVYEFDGVVDELRNWGIRRRAKSKVSNG